MLNQAVTAQYSAGAGVWYVTSDDLPLAQLDGRYVAQAQAAATQTVFSVTPNQAVTPSSFGVAINTGTFGGVTECLP